MALRDHALTLQAQPAPRQILFFDPQFGGDDKRRRGTMPSALQYFIGNTRFHESGISMPSAGSASTTASATACRCDLDERGPSIETVIRPLPFSSRSHTPIGPCGAAISAGFNFITVS